MNAKHLILLPLFVGLLPGCATTTPKQNTAAAPKPQEIIINGVAGFHDTPMEPDGKWHVHDPARPQPVIVTPGEKFSQMAPPPSDAMVLFDGKDLSQWRDKRDGGPAK